MNTFIVVKVCTDKVLKTEKKETPIENVLRQILLQLLPSYCIELCSRSSLCFSLYADTLLIIIYFTSKWASSITKIITWMQVDSFSHAFASDIHIDIFLFNFRLVYFTFHQFSTKCLLIYFQLLRIQNKFKSSQFQHNLLMSQVHILQHDPLVQSCLRKPSRLHQVINSAVSLHNNCVWLHENI